MLLGYHDREPCENSRKNIVDPPGFQISVANAVGLAERKEASGYRDLTRETESEDRNRIAKPKIQNRGRPVAFRELS